MPKRSAWEAVYAVVRAVPRGRVTTYGRISAALDRRLSALAVGWALNTCPDDVPWHRVLDAHGTSSVDRRPGQAGRQQRRLEAEGVAFDAEGRVDLDRYGWEPAR